MEATGRTPRRQALDPAPGTGAAAPADLASFSVQVRRRLLHLVTGLPDPLRSPVRDLAARPGKGLRAMLLAACARFGTADTDRLVRLGALVELVHLASLLHDDVIDRAAVRRGAPAAHTVVGNEMAMLAGLSCFALAGTEAADLGPRTAVLVSTTVAGLAYGEMLDVDRAFDTTLTVGDYIELVERKTGELFRLTCVLGASEARVGRREAQAMARFGASFGVAFQVLDDCLDLSTGELDKPTGTDHLLGLFGAPTLCALAADATGELASLLLSPSLGAGDMRTVRSRVAALGGIAEAEQLAEAWHRRALGALDELPVGDARAVLSATAGSIWRGRG